MRTRTDQTAIAIMLAILALTLAPMAMAEAPGHDQCCGTIVSADKGHSLDSAINWRWPRTIRGITIVMDFDDLPGTDDLEDIDNFLNQPGYTGHDANGSVRDYFYDVSDGLFTYENTVIPEYYRCEMTYAELRVAEFAVMDEVVADALIWLNDVYGFDFSEYDSNNDGLVDAVNILTTGYFTGGRALHPHMSYINVPGLDGKTAARYQTTNLGSMSQILAIFSHENGHLLFNWPDLRTDSNANTAGDLDTYCLMGWFSDYKNPSEPNAYLKMRVGWLKPLKLSGDLATGLLRGDVNSAGIVKHHNSLVSGEYFMIENRMDADRDAGLRDHGMAIYRINENDPDNLITLIQADGDGDINDDTNLFAGPAFDEFGFGSTPRAAWSNDAPALFRISDISGPGATMTYTFGEYEPAPVSIQPGPEAINAPWILGGPDNFLMFGTGHQSFDVATDSYYVAAFLDAPPWQAPNTPTIQKWVPELTGRITKFIAAYFGPFAPVSWGDMTDQHDAVGASIVDFNGDGYEDVYVVNQDGPNLLLQSAGGLPFFDVAPSLLADVESSVTAAWADIDNDGDDDVFVGSATGQHKLLGSTPTGLVDWSAQVADLGLVGPLNTASWSDVDQDGFVDLFLAREGTSNLLFEGSAVNPGNFAEIGLNGFVAASAAPFTQAVCWGDYDVDGYQDLYLLQNDPVGSANGRLVRNNDGVLGWVGGQFVQHNTVNGEWVDLNNDARPDLVLLRSDGLLIAKGWDETVGFDGVDIAPNAPNTQSFTTGDFDNNGYVDIYANRHPDPSVIRLNHGPDPVTGILQWETMFMDYVGLRYGAGAVAAADFNHDGGVDLFVGRQGSANYLLMNLIQNRGNWLRVELAGDDTNRNAVGARVEVFTDGMRQIRQISAGGTTNQNSRVLHFGLGEAATIDAVMVYWGGSSTPTILTGVGVNQTIAIDQESTKSSDQVEFLPEATQLYPAYPNPFNPVTNVSFALAQSGEVSVEIYGVDGRYVTSLHRGSLSAGRHEFTWHGTDERGRRQASGTYVYRVVTKDQTFTEKLMLVK